MSGRPEFIDRGTFRSYLSGNRLARLFRVDGVLPASYITREANRGRPIRCLVHEGRRVWRPIDVVARAHANGHRVEPPLVPGGVCLRCVSTREQTPEPHGTDVLKAASVRLTGKRMLTPAEIIAAAVVRDEATSGVYFLIRDGRVMYVGQSVDVGARIRGHARERSFDAYAMVPCPIAHMAVLESLYIHALRPPWNGVRPSGTPFAPFTLDALLTQAESIGIHLNP